MCFRYVECIGYDDGRYSMALVGVAILQTEWSNRLGECVFCAGLPNLIDNFTCLKLRKFRV